MMVDFVYVCTGETQGVTVSRFNRAAIASDPCRPLVMDFVEMTLKVAQLEILSREKMIADEMRVCQD